MPNITFDLPNVPSLSVDEKEKFATELQKRLDACKGVSVITIDDDGINIFGLLKPSIALGLLLNGAPVLYTDSLTRMAIQIAK